MKKKKFGFTMAEVLIAIAIIGVIAALVLPVMMKNYNNRIFATKARRAYTAVVDACSHGLSDDQVKYPGDIRDSYCEYIPGKSCTTGENGSVTLKDGTVLTLTGWGNNPGGDLTVEIDTNATKGPNADGKDRWYTKLTRDCKLADDGTNGTISYLKAHDWKITDDDASGSQISMESKCSFVTSGAPISICKQDDGTSKWCIEWQKVQPSYCQTFNGECKQINNQYFSCTNENNTSIYSAFGQINSTIPYRNCTELVRNRVSYMSCLDGDSQKLYNMDGSLASTLPSNCTPVGNTDYIFHMSCLDGDSQKLYNMDGSLASTFPSNCTPVVGNNFISCPDGENQKLYHMSDGSLASTLPSNCTAISDSGGYMSCPDGDSQKIYSMGNGSLASTFPSNCTTIINSNGLYMSCPDGNYQKIYNMHNGDLKLTFPNNYKYNSKIGYMSYFDGTQTKLYSMYNGNEQTSYAKAGDCANDSSTGLYVCTNGNKKTYYQSYSSSSGVEVDADCADPFCSNKQ